MSRRIALLLLVAMIAIAVAPSSDADAADAFDGTQQFTAAGFFGAEDGAAAWAASHEAGSEECLITVGSGTVSSSDAWTVASLVVAGSSVEDIQYALPDLVSGLEVRLRIAGDITGAGNLDPVDPFYLEDAEGCTSIAEGMFRGCPSIRSVTVTHASSIGDSAFSSCWNLISVTAGGEHVSIGDSAFEDCTVYNLALEEGVEAIGASAFKGCKMSSVVLPDGLTSIGDEAFAGVTTIRSVTLSPTIASFGSSVFSGCTLVSELTVPDGLVSIGASAFSGCRLLTSVEIPATVESIGDGAFSGCISVRSVELNGAPAAIGASAFEGCTALSAIPLASVVSVGSAAFRGCTSLRDASLGSVAASVGASAFEGCTSLTGFDAGTAAVDLTAFKGCTSLTELDATGSQVYRAIGGILYTADLRTLYMAPPAMSGQFHRSDLPSSVRTINLDYSSNRYYIDQRDLLNETEFVDTVSGTSAIGVRYSSLGMSECSLEASGRTVYMSYTLYPGWTWSVEDAVSVSAHVSASGGRIAIQPVSSSCTVYPMGLKTLSYAELDRVTSMAGWPNDWALVLTSPSYSDQGRSGTVTYAGVQEYQAVAYNGSAASTTLDGTIQFHGITFRVASVKLPLGNYGVLTDLTLGDGVAVPESAFEGSPALRSVTADHVSEVGASAFRNCTALASARFASCSSFGEHAFEGCRSLGELRIGAGIASFGDGALWGCSSLRAVLGGTVVSGTGGIPVVRLDDSMADCTFTVGVNCILVGCRTGSSVVAVPSDGPEASYTVTGGAAVVPLSDGMLLRLEDGVQGSGVVVAFDYGIGGGYTTATVQTGSSVQAPDPKTPSGYSFYRWMDGSEEFDPDAPVTAAKIVIATYHRDPSSGREDGTLAAMVAVVLAIVVVLPLAFGRLR